MLTSASFDWKGLADQCQRAVTVDAVFGFAGKRRGGYLRFACPFHDVSKQSDPRDLRLSVNPETFGWRCHHGPCQRIGDLLSFVNGEASPSGGDAYRAAVLALADRVAVAVPESARWQVDSAGMSFATKPIVAPLATP